MAEEKLFGVKIKGIEYDISPNWKNIEDKPTNLATTDIIENKLADYAKTEDIANTYATEDTIDSKLSPINERMLEIEDLTNKISVELYSGLTESQKATLANLQPKSSNNIKPVGDLAKSVYKQIGLDLAGYFPENSTWSVYVSLSKNKISPYQGMKIFFSKGSREAPGIEELPTDLKIGDIMGISYNDVGYVTEEDTRNYFSLLYQGNDQWYYCDLVGTNPDTGKNIYETFITTTSEFLAKANEIDKEWCFCYILRPEKILRKLFGLGSENPVPLEDYDSGINTGWYLVENPMSDYENTPSVMRVDSIDAENKSQTIYFSSENNAIHKITRNMNNSVWNTTWQWQNPPLIASKTYRLNEYFLGQPKYVKIVSIATLPPKDTLKAVSLKIESTIKQICGYEIVVQNSHGYETGGKSGSQFMDISKLFSRVRFYKVPNNSKYWHIELCPSEDLSSYGNAYLIVYYTLSQEA